MRFAAPLILLALVALPVLAIVYAGTQRDRRRAAAAFASPMLAASVTPRRPGWRRHGPALAIALALAALIVAAARPQRVVAVPVERAQVMLVTDVSGSMMARDVAPSRLVAARNAAKRFLTDVPEQLNVGLEAFNQTPRVLQSPTRDREALVAALDRLTVSGGTATGDAIQTAIRVLQRAPSLNGHKPPSAIVLLSDGASTHGQVQPLDAARAAARLKIPITTVALGTPDGTITVPRANGTTRTERVPPDTASLRQIAAITGGRAETASSASDLSAVYEKLGSQVGRKKEPREITAGFAGAGLALLGLATALSLRWFGRLI
ncbi:MAG TPA: VWA domain-containing protein [Baekduia sp.]|nr:VWA domain-containing protein [Baekduia sp.]